jgi:predicted ATPase/class 3 adenylate cyclase
MTAYPTGTVTFLFTDIEGSTRRWEEDSPAARAAVERHFALLDEAIRSHYGVLFKKVGDAAQAAFSTAADAVHAAVAGQRAMVAADWGTLGPVRVRMALHTGDATPQDGDYLAPALNRLARLLAAASGEQILLTETTRNLVLHQLPGDVELRDLGTHQLRDLREATHIYQVMAPDLPAAFPPLKSLDRPAHNLPAQVTAFIGRERETAEAMRRLQEPDVRLLTLTGPGGTGKTRLALQVATELTGEYDDGVWFVPLAPVANPSHVAGAIAEKLGLREVSGERIEDTLVDYVRRRRLLLVLDTFEHVVAAAPLVSDLLAAAPGVQVLATSRAPLRVSGEVELPVPPLGLPASDEEPTFDAIQGSAAVRLFVDRARAVRPGFALTATNASTIAAICSRLDGLPLAIELAAARIKLLPPEAILARLDKRLPLLTGGGRDLPERQQTLRAAIAWSHDLLDPAEQTIFRKLGVFVGGFTLDAAEAVAAGGGEPENPVLDSLAGLHDNSLVQSDESGPGSDTDPRFTMLQTIQEFALEQLAAHGEQEAVRAAHAAFFVNLAREAEPRLIGPETITWLDRLDAERGNVHAALSWLRDRGDSDRAVQLAAAMWRVWWLRGRISEGRDHLDAVLGMPGQPATATRAAALDGAGVLAETQGDYARADAFHGEALALSRQIGDCVGIARALGNLGVVALDLGDIDRASALLEESLSAARDTRDRLTIATSLNDLGNVAQVRGDMERAAALYQESLSLRRQLGDATEIARSINNLGVLALYSGDFADARRLFQEGLDLYRKTGDRWGEAGTLTGLALAIRRVDTASDAANLLAESFALFEGIGDARNAAVAALNLADTRRDFGDEVRAAAAYREALARFQRVGDTSGVVASLQGLAHILANRGEHELATRLLGAASRVDDPEEPSAPFGEPDATDADIAALRTALGDEAFAQAWTAGRALSPEEASAAALASSSHLDRD